MSTHRASIGILALIFCLSTSAAGQSGVTKLTKLTVQAKKDKTDITLVCSRVPSYSSFTLNSPFRLVIDIEGSEISGAQPLTKVENDFIDTIKVSKVGGKDSFTSRILVTFKKKLEYMISMQGNTLLINITHPATTEGTAKADAAKTDTSAKADAAKTGGTAKAGVAGADTAENKTTPIEDTAKTNTSSPLLKSTAGDGTITQGKAVLRWIGFHQTKQYTRVFLKTGRKIEYEILSDTNKQLVLLLKNTRISNRNTVRFMDTSYFNSVLTFVQPLVKKGKGVYIKFSLREKARYTIRQRAATIHIDFLLPINLPATKQ